jgi:hypothetical protein
VRSASELQWVGRYRMGWTRPKEVFLASPPRGAFLSA